MSERGRLLLLLAPYLVGLDRARVRCRRRSRSGLALTEYDLLRSPRFVGLDNFRELWDDDDLRRRRAELAAASRRGASRCGSSLALGLALLLHAAVHAACRDRLGCSRHAHGRPGDRLRPAVALAASTRCTARSTCCWTAGGDPERTVWGARLPQWFTDPAHARAGIVADEPVHDRRGASSSCSSPAAPIPRELLRVRRSRRTARPPAVRSRASRCR